MRKGQDWSQTLSLHKAAWHVGNFLPGPEVGGGGGFDRAIRVTTPERSLVARLTHSLPSIFCGFSDVDRSPV